MSFSPDILNKKLSSLQETQDSIVTISQWVLFHHRHSKETAELWAAFILNLPASGSSKKLSLFYLCNDVVQQAKHKRKMDFITEFSKVLPKVFNKVYKTLDPAIKPKVDRLLNVWSERLVFPSNDIKEMKKAIELSKSNKSVENDGNANASSTSVFEASKIAIASDLKLLNNIFLHMNQLIDISQGNLNQVGIQSKTYLPTDPSASDNLPSPKIYISKLNVLEKLCLMSNNNIEEIKKDRLEILKQLDNLRTIVSDGLQTDDSKVNIINKRLEKLNSTRSELQSIVNEDQSISQAQDTNEEPSPEFEQGEDEDDDDDMIPTYENEDSDLEDNLPPAKKAKHFSELSNNSTSSSAKKSVAFSEDIEVKEYDREDQTENIKIIKSDDDENGDALDNIYDDDDGGDDEDDDGSSVSIDFERHHKDDLELKHEHDNNSTDDDGYDPSSQGEDTSESNSSSMNNSVLNLLAKLA